MADVGTFAVDTRIPAAYANIFAVMTGANIRIVFGDRRDNIGRVAATETYVAEIVMPRDVAENLAAQIQYMLGLTPVEIDTRPVNIEEQNGGRVF
jgi:hypothetical protein